MSSLGRPLAFAAIIIVGLASCRSAWATVTLDFNVSPTGGSDASVTVGTSGTYTYYVGVSSLTSNNANTVISTSSFTNYLYEVTVTVTDNSPGSASSGQLIDSAVTVSTGTATIKNDVLTVKLSDDSFTAPVGSNLTLLSTLKITSINEGNSSTHDGSGGQGDPDTVSAYGQYSNPGTPSDGAKDNAGGSTTGFNASGTYADSGVNITNPVANSSYTLYNSMTFSLGTDNDTATVQNTVTVTAPTPAAPEPSTTILAASAFGTLALVRLRRRKAGAAA